MENFPDYAERRPPARSRQHQDFYGLIQHTYAKLYIAAAAAIIVGEVVFRPLKRTSCWNWLSSKFSRLDMLWCVRKAFSTNLLERHSPVKNVLAKVSSFGSILSRFNQLNCSRVYLQQPVRGLCVHETLQFFSLFRSSWFMALWWTKHSEQWQIWIICMRNHVVAFAII